MTTSAILVAGGRGTRLGRGPGAPPKALVEIQGRSLLEWGTRALAACRPERFVVVTRPDVMDAVTVAMRRVGAAASVVVQPAPLGTFDAIQRALAEIGDESDAAVLLADNVPPPSAVLAGARALPGSAGVLLARPDVGSSSSSRFRLQRGRAVGLTKEPGPDVGHVCPGLYFYSGDVVKRIRALVRPADAREWAIEDFNDRLLRTGCARVIEVLEPWIHINEPNDLPAAAHLLLKMFSDVTGTGQQLDLGKRGTTPNG